MRQTYRTIGGQLFLAGIGLLAFSNFGCVPAASKALPAAKHSRKTLAEEQVVVGDGTPQQLVAVMQTAAGKVRELAGRFAIGGLGTKPMGEIRRQVFTGIKAAEKLLAHGDSSGEDKKLARRTKLSLLFVGIQEDQATFERHLEEFVAQLSEEVPESEEAALGSACWLDWKYLSTNAPKAKVLPLLIEYAKTHPKSDAGIELFRSCAVKLESKRDRIGAIECYRTAIDLYAEHPKVRSLQQRLRKLEGGNRQRRRR